MKLEVNIGNKHLMFLAVFVAAIAVVGVAGAYNPDFSGGNPNIMGHSSDEIMVNLSGTPTSLQSAIDSGLRIKTGTYAGTGAPLDINVGFQPDSVMVLAHAGLFPSFKTEYMAGYYAKYSIYWADNMVALSPNGFNVKADNPSCFFNCLGTTYSYIAMKYG